MEKYEEMLDQAFNKIKKFESGNNGERFEIPKIKGHFEGKKTILTNFLQIASYLRRKPEHFQKFLLKELAAAGQVDSERLILNRNIPSSKINEKIESYVREFVLCGECKKPDTELIRDSQNRITFIHCLACGAKHTVRGI